MNENLDLIFQEIKDRLKDQLLSADQLATKLNFLLGFNTIVIAAIFPGLFNGLKTSEVVLHPFVILAIILLFFSIYFDFRGLKIQKYRRDPNPRQLYQKYAGFQEEATKKILISNYIASFEYNLKKLSPVRKCFRNSVVFSSLALVFIFLFFVRNSILSLWETIIKTICQI